MPINSTSEVGDDDDGGDGVLILDLAAVVADVVAVVVR